jgi:arylsulfatase A-like enzyme
MAGINDLAKQKEMEDSIDFEQPIKGGPIEHGFDYYFGDDVPNFPPYIFIENDYTVGLPTGRKPDDMFGHPGPALPGWDLSGVMPAITQKACSYLDAVNAVENPVFLYLPLTAPHTPIAPSPHFIGKSGAGWYGDYVMEVDWAVGQVIETLERNGLIENTLLIFTSDNGSPQRDGTDMNGETGSVKALGHDPSKPWRGMKSDIWEGGHRIPFIARWPKFLPAASITDQPFILSDLMRTIAGITGYDIPENMAGDSYDFSRLFMGLHTNAPIRNHLIHHSGNGVFAIRIDEWKLILGRDSGGFTKFEPPPDAPDGQLYHLKEDPMEQNNLYTDHPEIVKKLTTELEKIKREERWRQE